MTIVAIRHTFRAAIDAVRACYSRYVYGNALLRIILSPRMGILRKMFPGSYSTSDATANKPLIDAIHAWQKNETDENFRKVLDILMAGDANLFLTTAAIETAGKKMAVAGDTLNLTCIFDQGGVRTLTAFTSEQALHDRTTGRSYARISSRDILECAMVNHIQKIVIISDNPDMFVLKWQD